VAGAVLDEVHLVEWRIVCAENTDQYFIVLEKQVGVPSSTGVVLRSKEQYWSFALSYGTGSSGAAL